MSKNRKNFIIGVLGCSIIFIVGVLYILIPTYYGLSAMPKLNTNNLFLSLMIIYTSINLGFYYLIGLNPNHESIFLAVSSSTCGIINLAFSHIFKPSFALALNVLLFTIAITIIRLFTIAYYHNHQDAFFYIEMLLLLIFSITGLTLSISLFNDPLVQTIGLGFFVITISTIEVVRITTKCLLKAPRFLGKIKF